MHRCLAKAIVAGALVAGLLVCLAAGVGSRAALAAPAPRAAPRAATQAHVPAGATCENGVQASGAQYRICLPTLWNGGLVVYAHGYVSPTRPIEIPEDQMTLPNGVRLDDFVTSQGYAFATSSYRTNGLAVLPAQEDLVDVVNIFKAQHGQPGLVLVAGVSEGGLVAALLAEARPDVFSGALALCGPTGDFRRQVDYFGDARTLFDYFFPGLMPPTPVSIPADLLTTWETAAYSTTVKPVITDPANAARLEQLLATAQLPFDPAAPQTQEQSVEQVLWYNVYATNDATAKLGGQPFDNQARVYQGASDDAALNAGVQRFAADPAALAAISAYQTTGKLALPLVTMHTSGDPVVPAWHADLYNAKIAVSGRAPWHQDFRFDRYGHCTFTPLEVLGGFNRLVDLVTRRPELSLYLPLVGKNP